MQSKLLIAEDDVFIRAMIADFLRDSGFDVMEAGSADEALSIFRSGADVDVLFSDVKMPGTMDGCDLARRVNKDWPSTRVILTSGYSAALLEANDMSIDALLPKPYRPLSVLSIILSVTEPKLN